MRRRVLVMAVLLVSLPLLVACGSKGETSKPTPQKQTAPDTTSTRMAPGVAELDNGTVQALGTLEYRDIEGGFWALIGGAGAQTNQAATIAVIANGKDFADQLKPLEGKVVLVTGKKAEGVSTRMAGPEVQMESVQEVVDSGGAAQ